MTPARIHILLARKAAVGVVIRRGPSKTVCTMLWDLKTDKFRIGQWMRGRIYERRSDLSPDGKFMIYFAMNGHWNSPSGGSWTAISRVPYLKAVTLYPKGDCWFGGGLFLGNHTYWVNRGAGAALCEDSQLRVDPLYQPEPAYGGECPGVYYHRLQRDGWKLIARKAMDGETDVDVFEKQLSFGWKLRKQAYSTLKRKAGRGVYYDEHELLRPMTSEARAFPDWEWADCRSRRLLWSANGKIFAAHVSKAGIVAKKELHDLNDMRFEAIRAPYGSG